MISHEKTCIEKAITLSNLLDTIDRCAHDRGVFMEEVSLKDVLAKILCEIGEHHEIKMVVKE